MKRKLAAAVLALSMFGCHKKTPPPVLPPAPAPAPSVQPPLEKPPEIPPEKPLVMPPEKPTERPPEIPPEPVEPSQPAPPPRPRPAPPKPKPASPPPPTPPFPQLGQILTDSERQQHVKAISRHLANARAYLATLQGRRLSVEQQSGVARVDGLIRQAEEARNTDLVTARGLAERAETLARDLAK